MGGGFRGVGGGVEWRESEAGKTKDPKPCMTLLIRAIDP